MNQSTICDSKVMKRTSNFTAAEIDLLLELVKKYKSVLECMKTDTVNAKMKKEAWVKIENEFNCQSIENFRSAVVLKNKYENIKRNVKKQYAEEKLFSRGTGGGPVKVFPNSSVGNTVGELLQCKMTGETSIYDSDCIINEKNTLDNIDYVSEEDEHIITVTNFEDFSCDFKSTDKFPTEKAESKSYDNPSTSSQKRDWTNYTPADLKARSTLTSSKADDVNLSKRHKSYQDKIACWASNRAKLSEQQQDASIEQHNLKTIFMREKHDAEMKMMAEKHKIEIENLLLQKEILQLQKQKYTN